MSNVFDGALSDSDDDLKPRLPPLSSLLDSTAESTAETIKNKAEGATAIAEGDSDNDEGGDEEAELRRMRASNGYAAFEGAAKARRARREAGAAAADSGACEDSEGSIDDDEDDDYNFAHGPVLRPSPLQPPQPQLPPSGDVSDHDGDGIAPGPALPPHLQNHSAPGGPHRQHPLPRDSRPRKAVDPKIIDESSDDDEDSSSDGGALPQGLAPARLDALPLTHAAAMGTRHAAQVVALALDPAGARFVTASADASLKLWDFAAMDRRLCSFRAVEDPLGTGPLTSAQFSATGSRLLVAGSLTVAHVLDRDARPLVESAPGDMYIVDMARTKGHVAQLTAARWLGEEHMFATIAGDGTLRLWDVAAATAPSSVFDGNLPRAKQLHVVKLRNARGNKTNASAMTVMPGQLGCNVSGNSGCIALGCDDGSIKLIDPSAPSGTMLAGQNARALPAGIEVTWLEYSPSTSMLLSRSTDDSLRVFDVRRFDQPLAHFNGLPNAVAQTAVTFMGNADEWIVTGTSANRRGGTECARVVVFDSKTLSQAWEAAVEEDAGSVIAVSWHPRINQLFYGCANGSVHAMYSPEHSRAGVLQCITKMERRTQHGMVAAGVGEIYAPNALPMFRDKSAPAIVGGAGGQPRGSLSQNLGSEDENGGLISRASVRRRIVLEPKRSDIPDPSKMSGTFTKAFMNARVKSTWADEDPREALLKLDKISREQPVFTAAYQRTQPVTEYAAKTVAQEEEEERQALNSRRKRARRSDYGK
jgi:WD repeat-containing protein 70